MASSKKKSTGQPVVKPEPFIYQFGKDPEQDAWYVSFFIENHLDYDAYPDHVSSPEQIRFMVYLDEENRYYPCSDQMFAEIMGHKKSKIVQAKYNQVLERIMSLIESRVTDTNKKTYLKALIDTKFKHETKDQLMLPSRIEKRLLRIFMNSTLIEDPYMAEKALRNWRANLVINSMEFKQAMDSPGSQAITKGSYTLNQIRTIIERLEIERYLCLLGHPDLWMTDKAKSYTKDDYLNLFDCTISGNGTAQFLDLLAGNSETEDRSALPKRKLLWLINEAGEVVLDIALIRYLSSLGHKIIIAFKEGPIFTKVDFIDAQEDQSLKDLMENVLWFAGKNISKNELIKQLRSESDIFAISDGTRENINLLLTSTSFARIFKEVDAVISRGTEQKRRLFESHFEFTQDIFNISATDDHGVEISYKPRHHKVIKFSYADLEAKADQIIDQMQDAKKQGMTVVFYSGIIGSIPGNISVAKKVMTTFIAYLQDQTSKTFIINPSKYYEPGMDADDLMYMWEIVQRSGMIDIWRFQTYGDIFQAFQLLKSKVPPEWVGKDATYSTGCTKEMGIAMDVQQKHPEMQIIGPAKERFMRRCEYGIGKMYDRRLTNKT